MHDIDIMMMTRDELINEIATLRQECDDRHMHEDDLENQVLKLGGTPVRMRGSQLKCGGWDDLMCSNNEHDSAVGEFEALC